MDRRVKYTMSVIKESFLNLLETKDLKKITVSEICKTADINRATFYRYYLDVYDLFNKIQENMIIELKEAIKNNGDVTSVFNYTRCLLSIFINEKKLSKIIFSNIDNGEFLHEMLSITYEKCYDNWKRLYPNANDEDINYASIFIFNGAIGIINYWIKNDFDKDIDYISDLVQKLSYDGINKFIKTNK